MNRNIRSNINTSLTVAGMVIIFSTFLYESTLEFYFRFSLVILGVIFLEIGVWGLSSKVLPSERQFKSLRTEGDRMIALIRQLNAVAISKDGDEEGARKFKDTLDKMHDSVRRMSTCAGERN